MKSILIFVVALFISGSMYGQKKMVKSISAQNIENINLNFDQVYKIELRSTDAPNIKIVAQVEGENSEHIVITNRRYANSLFLSSGFQPAYKDSNDKLSAHKVLSINISIYLPKEKTVYLKSDIANVEASGIYKKLTLELENGNCSVNEFMGNALVNTQKGDIIFTTDHVKVDAKSQSGKLDLEALTDGMNKITLNSVNGDIKVIKSQE